MVNVGTKASHWTGSVVDDDALASAWFDASLIADLDERLTERRLGCDVAGVVFDLFDGLSSGVEIKDRDVLVTTLAECESDAEPRKPEPPMTR